MVNKLVFENLKHRPVRTLLSALVIGVQVTTMLTLVGLSRGLLEDSARRARGVGADIWVRPEGSTPIGFTSASLDERLIAFLEKQPHVAIATGVVEQPIGGTNRVTGIDFMRFNKMSGGFKYLQGGPLGSDYDIIADEFYAAQNKWHVGQTVDILNRPWHVSGIVEAGKLAHIVVPIKTLQSLTANTGKVSQIFVRLDDSSQLNSVLDQLKNLLPGKKIYSLEEFTSLFSVNNVPGLRAFINVIIGISVVVGFLVVFLSMYTAVLERTREIGILKALGASPTFILGMLVRETVVLALAGSVLGIALAYATRGLIMNLVPASLPVVTVPDWWYKAALIALIGALLGAVYPGLKAARQDAIEALAYD